MDPFLILGLVVYATMGSILLAGVWLSKRELRVIKDEAVPLMVKANSILTPEVLANLTDLRMVPATIQAGMEKMLKDQLETQGSPLRVYTRAVIEEGVSAFSASLSQQFGALKTLAPAAASLMGQRSVEVRADKKEGRESVAALLEQFGPVKNLIEKLVPASKREDPAEFLAYLGKMKGMISQFAPGIGQMLDGQIEQFLMGGMGGGIENVGDIVKMFPVKTAAAGGDGAPDYMRA